MQTAAVGDSSQTQPETTTSSSRADGYDFRSLLPATTARPGKWTNLSASYILKDAFHLRTLLAIGAGLQMALSAAVKSPWCFLPTAVLLALALATTLFQMLAPSLSFRGHPLTHPFLAGTVPGRSTTYLPSSTTGRYAPENVSRLDGQDGQGGAGVVVFHFGARFNHPLGVLAPGARTMTKLFRATITALEADRSVYSLLGADLFRGGARATNDTILLVLYFRDVAGLQRFAGSAAHQQAYRWLRDVTGREGGGRYGHLSAFHETFCVPAGSYETLYINTAPILLGNTYTEKKETEEERREERGETVVEDDEEDRGRNAGKKRGGKKDNTTDDKGGRQDGKKEDKKEKLWLNSLVDADDIRLWTMAARLKRAP